MTVRKKRLAIFLCLTMLLSVYTPLVSSAAVYPTVGAAVSTNNAVQVVSTQAMLDSALTKGGVRQIVIKTDQAVAFNIAKGSYSNKNLVVRAPKAEINNEGTFKRVTIYSISDKAFTENADHNKLRVLAPSGRIVVPAGKTADSLTVLRKNSKVKIDVRGTVQQMDVKKAANLAMDVTGSIKKMNVNATSTITVTGDSKDTTIIVNKAAKNSRITVSAPATVKLKAATTVTLKTGAENAKLVIPKSSAKAVSYTLVNETNSTLKLNTSSGTKTLANGKSYNGKESGSSGTIITGGGGSSGGSGGGNSGGTTKPAEPEKPPVIEKKELPVAAEITGLNSFCVYVDAVDDPGELEVTVKSDGNEIALRASTASAIDQTKAIYGEKEELEHVYGYCYTYSVGQGQSFDLNKEYTVAINGTDAYQFEAQTMKASVLKESLKPYEDVLRDALEEMYFDAKEGDDAETLLNKINQQIEQQVSSPMSDPNPLQSACNLLQQNGVEKVISIDQAIVNGECPLHIQLRKDGIEREFECKVVTIDSSEADGMLWFYRCLLQDMLWELKIDTTSGKEYYDLPKIIWDSAVVDINSWSSSSNLVEISDSKAWITKPAVGVEKVTLTADIFLNANPGKKIEAKRTILLDSNIRMSEYTVNIGVNDSNTLQIISEVKSDISDGKEPAKDETALQWCRIPVGSKKGAVEMEDATGDSYTPGDAGETGTYWYCCKLTSSFESETNVFYSNFVKVTIE